MRNDITSISQMGRIIDNSYYNMAPLTVFNQKNFGIFEYSEKLNKFEPLPIKDEENLSDRIPKMFKSVYLGNESETYLIAGGLEYASEMKSSERAFLLEKDGLLSEVMPMYYGRQNFAMTVVQAPRKPRGSDQNAWAYCIGGFSIKEGALDHVERFSLDNKEWELASRMTTRRINPGSCSINNTHIYVFGGRSEGEEYFDSIERFNIELNIWSLLSIKLPQKLCNTFAFPFTNGNEDHIIILGGLKKKDISNKNGGINYPLLNTSSDYDVDPNVYMYNRTKEVWV